MCAASGFNFRMVIGDNRVKSRKKCAELGLKILPDMVYLTQEALKIAGVLRPIAAGTKQEEERE